MVGRWNTQQIYVTEPRENVILTTFVHWDWKRGVQKSVAELKRDMGNCGGAENSEAKKNVILIYTEYVSE